MCSKIDSEARCSHFLTTYAFYVPTVCFHYSWSRQPPFRFKKLEVNGSFGIIEDWSQLLMDGNIRYVLHSQLNTFSTPVIALLHIIPSLYWCLYLPECIKMLALFGIMNENVCYSLLTRFFIYAASRSRTLFDDYRFCFALDFADGIQK